VRWALEQLTQPEDIDVVSLARMKRELREFASVTTRDDDITAKLVAAREWIEDLTGRILVDETWRLTIDHDDELDFASLDTSQVGVAQPSPNGVYLRRSPVIAVTSIATVDSDGVETTVDEADYELRAGDSKWPFVAPLAGTWLASNMRITFRAGFADRTGSPMDDATAVPARFKEAMILWVKGNYDGDDASTKAAMDIAMKLRAQVGFA
jgi:hypothetical protein